MVCPGSRSPALALVAAATALVLTPPSHSPPQHTERKNGPRKNRTTEREGPACVGLKRIIRENTVVLQSYSEHYFSILDLLFYPRLRKIISKIENFPLFHVLIRSILVCTRCVWSHHLVCTWFLSVPLKLVLLGSFAFLAVGSVLVSRPFYDNHCKNSRFIYLELEFGTSITIRGY